MSIYFLIVLPGEKHNETNSLDPTSVDVITCFPLLLNVVKSNTETVARFDSPRSATAKYLLFIELDLLEEIAKAEISLLEEKSLPELDKGKNF